MNSATLGLIIVGAGSSRRMEGLDKTWTLLAGNPLVFHSLRSLGPIANQTVLVIHADHVDKARREAPKVIKSLTVVEGGERRSDSVRQGLEALGSTDAIAIHDAARPFATAELLSHGLKLLDEADGAIPVLPVHDTLKRVDPDGKIRETVSREHLRRAQTPQVFRSLPLRSAHAESAKRGEESTDDAFLLEKAGYDVRWFRGEERNFKITTRYDLEVANLLAEG